MRATVTIDDALYETALGVAVPSMDKADLFREAVKTFVQVQAARRLAALGGTMPKMLDVPRAAPAPTAPGTRAACSGHGRGVQRGGVAEVSSG